jgi:hypothetical protein
MILGDKLLISDVVLSHKLSQLSIFISFTIRVTSLGSILVYIV